MSILYNDTPISKVRYNDTGLSSLTYNGVEVLLHEDIDRTQWEAKYNKTFIRHAV